MDVDAEKTAAVKRGPAKLGQRAHWGRLIRQLVRHWCVGVPPSHIVSCIHNNVIQPVDHTGIKTAERL